jgi:ferrochelatase
MTRRCDYEIQIRETCRLVADSVGVGNWDLAYQSRSGPPHQPWLEPDICDHLEGLGKEGNKNVIVSPIGFLSDHMEVVYDLDTEAQAVCREAGMVMVRAKTVGIHPSFVRMVRELVEERLSGTAERPFLGRLGPSPDDCPGDCCLASR